jgi:hypothetical protein
VSAQRREWFGGIIIIIIIIIDDTVCDNSTCSHDLMPAGTGPDHA